MVGSGGGQWWWAVVGSGGGRWWWAVVGSGGGQWWWAVWWAVVGSGGGQWWWVVCLTSAMALTPQLHQLEDEFGQFATETDRWEVQCACVWHVRVCVCPYKS